MNELELNLRKLLALSIKTSDSSETAAGGKGRRGEARPGARNGSRNLCSSLLPFHPLTHRNAPLLAPVSAAAPRPPARPQPFSLASCAGSGAGPHGNRFPCSFTPPRRGREEASLPPARSCSADPRPPRGRGSSRRGRGAGGSGAIRVAAGPGPPAPPEPAGTRGSGGARQRRGGARPGRSGAKRSEGSPDRAQPRPGGARRAGSTIIPARSGTRVSEARASRPG